MLRNKISKLLAMTMIVTALSGVNIQQVGATEISSVSQVEYTNSIKDGNYNVPNSVEYVGSGNAETGNHSARAMLKEETNIKCENGKVTMTLSFNPMYDMITSTQILLNGQELEINEDKTSRTISFEVPSVESQVQVVMTMPFSAHSTVAFNVINDLSTLENEDSSESEKQTVAVSTDSTMAGNFLNSTGELEVKNGEYYLTLTMTGSSYMSNQQVYVNKNEVEVNKSVNGDETKLTFKVSSLSDEIKIKTLVTAMNREVEFNVFVTTDSLPENPEDNETPVVPENPGDNETPEVPSVPEESTKISDINVSTDSAMAGQFLSNVGTIEEVNGEKYVTLTMTGSTYMSNQEIYVNGTKVNHTKVVNGDETSFRFKVSSLSDAIKIKAFVTAMGRSVEFNVTLSEQNNGGVTNNGSSNNSTSNNNSSNAGSSNNVTNNESTNNTTNTENTTKTVTTRIYTIENEVYHESTTGQEMARKYLNSTSKVEEINGVYYVTLTFTGSEFMQDHVIYVNGSKANITKSTSGDTTNIRFMVSSLDDTIKVSTFVAPMNRNVEFQVKLLKDTLTFVSEHTVEVPATSDPISMGSLAGLALMAIGSGAVAFKKRK